MNHREYFDQVAAKWNEVAGEEPVIRLREIVAGLGIEPGARVLDVGCGTGVLFPVLPEKVGWEGRIVGLDISGEMLRRARVKGCLVECIQGDAHSLPLEDNAFDWVICNAVFPHFSDRLGALCEIHRVLKDEGRLVICHTNSRETINESHRSVDGAVANDTIPDEEEMQQLLSEARLREVEVRDEPDRYLVTARRRGDDSSHNKRLHCLAGSSERKEVMRM